MSIEFKKITKNNWQEVISLSVNDDQTDFVASNVFSLAQAKYEKEMVPVAIYHCKVMVGFAMYGKDPATNRIWIVRFMIDQRFQKQGFGEAAIEHLVDLLMKTYNCTELYLSFEPDNIVADKLYSKAGFVRTGEIEEGELVMKLSK